MGNISKKEVVNPNKYIYLIGHSIGCQAILRYLELLEKKSKIGGAVFVAGWFNLTKEATPTQEEYKIAEPWIKTKINFKKVLKHTKKFIAIFSDNDPYVNLGNAKKFKNVLKAKIIIVKNKGHFTEDDNVEEMPVVIKELVRISTK